MLNLKVMGRKMKKLELSEQELKNLLEVIFDLYVIKRWSLKKIGEYLGTSEWQIVKLSKKYGLSLRRTSSTSSRF